MGWKDDFQAEGQRKISAALQPPSDVPIGNWSTTVRASPDYGAGDRRYDRSIPANIRHNNPGATYPAKWMAKYGMNGVDTIGGGHLIANFPNAASGAAANFELMERQYAGKPLDEFIQKWSGGNSSGSYAAHVAKEVGISPNTVITKDMIRDPSFAPKLLKAQLGWESGRGNKWAGLNDQHLEAAHAMYRNGNGQPVSQSAAFTPPQTVNRDGIITTLPNSPQPASMPTVQPSKDFASNMPVYRQQPAATPPLIGSQPASYNPQTGTTMHPTPGRDVIPLAGKTPEQQRDALQGAYDHGNKNMLYVNDENPRVVARPGDAKWSPTPPDSKTGPTFANSFLASNSDYGKTGLPMSDDNALKGSRYDDGTATGTVPSPGSKPAQPTQTAALTPPSVVPSVEASQLTPATTPSSSLPPPTIAQPPMEATASTASPVPLGDYSKPSQIAASNYSSAAGSPAPQILTSRDPSTASAALTPPSLSATSPSTTPSPQMAGGGYDFSSGGKQLANAADIPVQMANATPAKSDPPSSLAASAPPVASSAATTPPTLNASSARPLEAAKAQTATPTLAPESKMALGAPTPPTDTPETSDATVKTKTSAATTPPDQAKPFDLLGNLFGDLPSKKGPQNYMPAQQWNLNPANPGVKWASGGFSSFGSN